LSGYKSVRYIWAAILTLPFFVSFNFASEIDCTEQALREAVSSGGQVIFPVVCTITLTENLPPITHDLEIEGNGTVIDGTRQFQMFHAPETASITLHNLTLQNGWTENPGGAVYTNSGNILITESSFFGNTASESEHTPPMDRGGGALFAESGNISVRQSRFVGNSASQSGWRNGGAIGTETGSVEISQSLFMQNGGVRGGAIRVSDGDLHIERSYFDSNRATDGGAIYQTSGDLVVEESLFVNNSARPDGRGSAFSSAGHGGAIDTGSGHSTLTNNVFYQNVAGWGGAINIEGGDATLTGNTIVENRAIWDGGGLYTLALLAYLEPTYTIRIEASENVLVDNEAEDLYIGFGSYIDGVRDIQFVSERNNTVENIEVQSYIANDLSFWPSEQVQDAPELDFEELLTPDPDVPTYEAPVHSIACTETALRDAVMIGGVINMPEGCTIFLKDHLPNNHYSLTINGNGSTLDGGGEFSIFQAESAADLTLKDLTLQNGYFTNYDYSVGGGAAYTMRGILSLQNCTLLENESETGGGAAYTEYGYLRVEDSHFEANIAKSGGAMMSMYGEINIRGSYFYQNSATAQSYYGGGAVALGYLNHAVIDNSIFIENSTADWGGAVATDGSRLTIRNSTFVGNHAASGGAIGSVPGSASIELFHSTIVGNSAALIGGGVFASEWNGEGEIVITLGYNIILDNEAPEYPDLFVSESSGNALESQYNIIGQFEGEATFDETDQFMDEADLGIFTGEFFLLRESSPALDAIPLELCALEVDQRGVSRPQGGGCDIGAVEMEE
jgi:hypothetical protein